ncbi:hypothetical protein CBF33_08600 [Vagococcus lutrae]|nr:hypothetical protein CBF33_08600 [Vagococcus lutrae]
MKKFKKFILKFSFMNEEYYAILMYLIMGGITTVINIVSFWLFNEKIGINYTVSNIIAWIFSVLFAYISNKLYVFESKHSTLTDLYREIASFFGFRLLSLFMDLLAMFIMISLLHIAPLISKILANVVVLIANYLFSKFFIFKKNNYEI